MFACIAPHHRALFVGRIPVLGRRFAARPCVAPRKSTSACARSSATWRCCWSRRANIAPPATRLRPPRCHRRRRVPAATSCHRRLPPGPPLPLLGLTIETGPAIDWRRDYLHGISTGTRIFPPRALSRFRTRRRPQDRLGTESPPAPGPARPGLAAHRPARVPGRSLRPAANWLDANPFLRGINWASALEVAFRALSWTWSVHLAGAEMPP